jgi:hypothetical protein
MTWLGQVLHVARKDVREEAWPLGGYLAVTAIATATVFGQTALGYGSPAASVVFLLGMVLAAGVVQSDSPTISTSFWGSRPFHPTALLGAKVLVVLLIVVAPAIGQVVALSAFDVHGRQMVLLIGHSARVNVVWLLAAMVVAGLTRDMRTFIVSLAAIYYATIFLAQPLANVLGGPGLWTAIGISGAIALLVFLYRRRDARPRIWIVAIAVVTSAVTGATMSDPTLANATTANATPSPAPAAMRIPIRVELPFADRLGEREYLSLVATAGGDAGPRRLVLAIDRVTVRLKDGTAVPVRGRNPTTVVVAAGNPLGANIHRLRGPNDFESHFSLELSPEERAAISKGVNGLELSGTVYVSEPRIIGALPITQKQSLIRNGTRLRVLNVAPASDGGTLIVERVSVAQLQETSPLLAFAQRSSDQYFLVNDARGEAVYLSQNSSTTGPGVLVLPSLRLGFETATLQQKGFQGTVRDAAWFMGTRVALVGWTLRGSYDVRVPIVEVPTPAEYRQARPVYK